MAYKLILNMHNIIIYSIGNTKQNGRHVRQEYLHFLMRIFLKSTAINVEEVEIGIRVKGLRSIV